MWRRESAVVIATGYGLDNQGFGVRTAENERFFFSPLYAASYPIGLFPKDKASEA